MEQGTILTWLRAAGDTVAAGDELVEIETDKSTVVHAAEWDGVLEILAEQGTTVPVGELIARLGQPVASPPPGQTAPASPGRAAQAPVSLAPGPPAPRDPHANGDTNGNRAGRRRLAATPLARRIASAHGVALEQVEGTGPLGRITRTDVMTHAGLSDLQAPALPTKRLPAPPAPTAEPTASPPSPPASARHEPASRLQQLIARRMTEAKATIPHFQVQTDVVMDDAIALRAEIKALAGEHDAVPSFNDLIVKACAVALREHPLANGSYADGAFLLHEHVNVGVAVAAAGALVVPTIFDADGKSLGQIARETRALASRVRSNEVTPRELEGGTFTVSNLGMYGMTAITPVINPPQAAIVGVGAMRAHLARVDGELVERTLLTLTLSCDHRILYGADAAQFLSRIRDLLETPLKLAL